MSSLLGVSLPYLHGAYGHDLAPSPYQPDWPCAFDRLAAYRPLLEARALGLGAVRIALSEAGEGITLDEAGGIAGVHPRLLQSIVELTEGASTAGVRVYWTLLDGSAPDSLTRAILSEPDAARRFAERVVASVARALDPGVTVALEIVHGPEALALEWPRIGRAITLARDAARAERGELLVTAGTSLSTLSSLVHATTLDALDVHVRADESLPTRETILRAAGDAYAELPRFAGCALADAPGDASYAEYAERLVREAADYDAVFLSRLEGPLVDARDPRRPFTELGRAFAARGSAR